MRLSQLSLLVRVTVDWFLACICSLWNFDASSLWERLSTASACIRVCTRKRSFENPNEGFSTHITHERFLCKAHHSCTLRLHNCTTDFTHGLPETKGFTCALFGALEVDIFCWNDFPHVGPTTHDMFHRRAHNVVHCHNLILRTISCMYHTS